MTAILANSSSTDAKFTVVAPPVLGDDAISALAALLLDCAEAERPEKFIEWPRGRSEVPGK